MHDYRLDYIKMDFNGNLTSSENYEASGARLWNHYQGLFELWSYMRERYPDLVVENCSSGSLRMDPAIAAHTDTHWVSDEVSPHYNLAMDFAMTYLFPPEICNHWTTFPETSPSLDLQGNFRTSMMGQFGLSGSILEWEPETLETARHAISEYKRIRPRLRRSEVYHLTGQIDPREPNTFQAAQYFDPSTGGSLLFAFRAGDAANEFQVGTARNRFRNHLPDSGPRAIATGDGGSIATGVAARAADARILGADRDRSPGQRRAPLRVKRLTVSIRAGSEPAAGATLLSTVAGLMLPKFRHSSPPGCRPGRIPRRLLPRADRLFESRDFNTTGNQLKKRGAKYEEQPEPNTPNRPDRPGLDSVGFRVRLTRPRITDFPGPASPGRKRGAGFYHRGAGELHCRRGFQDL